MAMTDEQFGRLMDLLTHRLDKIIELLEIQAFDLVERPCAHSDAVDIGVMGMAPGERMRCKACGEIFSQVIVAEG